MLRAFFTILGLVAAYTGLVARGVMTPATAAQCLVGLVVLLAIGRAMGTGLIGALVRVGGPIVALLALARQYSGGNQQVFVTNIGQLLAIGLMLFGIYITLTGPFRSRR